LIPRTVLGVGSDLGAIFGLLAAPSMRPDVKLAATFAVLALCLVGLRRLSRSAPVTALFIAAYTGIVLLWPFSPLRFVWGIWPLVFLLPVLGALEIARWRPQMRTLRAARLAALACACLIAAGYTRYTARAYTGHWWSSITRQGAAGARPLVLWVRAHTPPDAVIASNDEPTIYLYGNRLSVPIATFTVGEYSRSPTVTERADALRAILGLYHVDDVAVVSLPSVRTAMQAMASNPKPELVFVDSLVNGAVYSPVSPR
jgi:hypothetical protein